MTLTGLIGQYVRHNWRPYLLSAMMLASVSALTVFIPRQVGHVVDGLVQGTLGEDALLAGIEIGPEDTIEHCTQTYKRAPHLSSRRAVKTL